MQARNEKLENVKRHVSAIENSVFADFCRNINVPDIGYYEKNHLWYKLFISFTDKFFTCVKGIFDICKSFTYVKGIFDEIYL